MGTNIEWTTETPKEKGYYWFYGEWRGGMGCHFFDDPPPLEPKVHFVNVWRNSTGICEGHFVSLNKFNKTIRQEGYIGYWKKAKVPNPPIEFNLTPDGIF